MAKKSAQTTRPKRTKRRKSAVGEEEKTSVKPKSKQKKVSKANAKKKAKTEDYQIHHKLPRFLGGDESLGNKSWLPTGRHVAFHTLVGKGKDQLSPCEFALFATQYLYEGFEFVPFRTGPNGKDDCRRCPWKRAGCTLAVPRKSRWQKDFQQRTGAFVLSHH